MVFGILEKDGEEEKDSGKKKWFPLGQSFVGGFDDAGASAAEVKAPSQIYPKAFL